MLFPQEIEGHPCSPHFSGSLQGEEVGLDSPSPPSVPTSNVIKVPVQEESRDSQAQYRKEPEALTTRKAQAQESPWPFHCYLVYSGVVCPQLQGSSSVSSACRRAEQKLPLLNDTDVARHGT